jgi:glycosyltransferase involved in cell wall biosynthesis
MSQKLLLTDSTILLDLVDVILVKADAVVNQPTIRDQKIIKSLGKKFSTLVLAWNRGGTGLPEKQYNSYGAAFKFLDFKAPAGAPPLFLYLPFFWTWVFVNLLRYRPRVVHACDFEALPPCYLYRKIIRNNKFVFDAFDRFAMAYIPRRRIMLRVLYSIINSAEDRMAGDADVLISVSEELIGTFRARPKECVPILNCAEDYKPDILDDQGRDGFTIAFTGHIRRDRGLEELINITSDLNLNLIITGRVADKELLHRVSSATNIRYLGYLEHSQVLAIESTSDVMIALYNLKATEQNKYVVGNKLFEAMMCGVPIITNVATEIVKETQCGIIVDYDNISQIKSAIVKLRDDPGERKRLGDNGRRAFLNKYNWELMEKRLYKVYEVLMRNS